MTRWKARLRESLVLAALRALAALVRWVPRRRAEPLCRWAGLGWYLVAPEARAAVRANLWQILGREPTPGKVREVFRHGTLSYWDTFALPQMRPEDLLRLVDVEGWEHLDSALAQGKGAILAGAHLSSVSLAGRAVAAHGPAVVGVAEAVANERIFAFINALRQSLRVRLLPAGPGAVKELLLALRRNEVLGLISDRDVLGTGPTVTFFGAATTFPEGPAALSLRTGAPLLPAAAIRMPDGRFRGWIEPPLPHPTAGHARQAAQELTQALAGRLEYHIGAHPEQWTVFQRRWPSSAGPHQ